MEMKKGMMKKAMDNLSLFILSLILIGGILVLIDNSVTATNHEVCGDLICEGSEDANNCVEDCSECGDGICDSTEDEYTCEEDCCEHEPWEPDPCDPL